MRPEDLRHFRDQVPFLPFRVVFTDGRSFDVPHRDFLYIGPHTIEILVVAQAGTEIQHQRIIASPLHVVRVEAVVGVA